MRPVIYVVFFIPLLYSMHSLNPEPAIEHNIPGVVKAGVPENFSIKIYRNQITGPFRVRIGFDNDKASVICENTWGGEIIKREYTYSVSWATVPQEEIIQLDYTLFAATEAKGIIRAEITLTWFEKNEIKEKRFPVVIIQIVQPESALNNNYKCERKIIKKNKDEIEVTIKMNKPSTGGYARVFEKLPENCTVKKVIATGVSAKSDGNMLKLSWDDFYPEKTEVEFSYIFTCSLISIPEISGSFVADAIPTDQSIPIQTTVVKDETISFSETNNNVNTKSDNLTHHSQNNTENIYFSVQVVASHFRVNQSYFEKYYNFSEEITIEEHEGWIKYTVGKFNSYQQAREKRSTLLSFPFKGPFVTAYKNNKRVHVKEALNTQKKPI
jgi:hypothetical protein